MTWPHSCPAWRRGAAPVRSWLIAMLLLFTWAGAALAQGPLLSLPEFADRLERAARELSAGRHYEAAAQFASDQVTLSAPDGDLRVDLRWLRQAADRRIASGPERDALVSQLYAMAAEARAVEASGRPGLEARLQQAARDRELLMQILGGAGYREAEAPSWWSRFWQRVGEWWARSITRPWREFWSRLDPPGLPRGTGARAFGTLAILIIIGLLLWLGRDLLTFERLRGLFRRKAASSATGPAPEPPDQLRRQALALAEAGQRREAIKLLVQATLGALTVRRLIDWQPMLTNRRYLQQLRRRQPALVPAFDELNGLFERKVYGEQPASSEEFHRVLALTDQLREEGSVSSAS